MVLTAQMVRTFPEVATTVIPRLTQTTTRASTTAMETIVHTEPTSQVIGTTATQVQ